MRTIAFLRSSDRGIESWLRRDKEASARINKLQEEIDKSAVDPEVRALLEKIGQARKAYVDARNETFALRSGTEPGGAGAARQQADAGGQRLHRAAARVRRAQGVARIEQNGLAAEAQAVRGRNALLGLALVALLFAALFAWLLVRSITRPLSLAVEVADEVASGDLTRAIDTRRDRSRRCRGR